MKLTKESTLNKWNIIQSKSTPPQTGAWTCDCKSADIAYYCRDCCKYLCWNCRMNVTHMKHSVIHIDITNYEESLNWYSMTLENEIEEQMKVINQQPITQVLLTQEGVTPRSKNWGFDSKMQAKITKQLSFVASKYDDLTHKCMNEIKVQLEYDNEHVGLNEYILNGRIIKGEIEKINQDINMFYKSPTNKLDTNGFIEFFSWLNEKENTWKDLSTRYLPYKIKSEWNDRINNMYLKLNEVINEFIQQNPMLQGEQSTEPEVNIIKEIQINRVEEVRVEDKKEEIQKETEEERRKRWATEWRIKTEAAWKARKNKEKEEGVKLVKLKNMKKIIKPDVWHEMPANIDNISKHQSNQETDNYIDKISDNMNNVNKIKKNLPGKTKSTDWKLNHWMSNQNNQNINNDQIIPKSGDEREVNGSFEKDKPSKEVVNKKRKSLTEAKESQEVQELIQQDENKNNKDKNEIDKTTKSERNPPKYKSKKTKRKNY